MTARDSSDSWLIQADAALAAAHANADQDRHARIPDLRTDAALGQVIRAIRSHPFDGTQGVGA